MKQKTFAERLREGLALRNMKAAELAELTGIGESSISQYKSGKYEAKQDGVYKIAKALDVSEGWLMGLDVPMERVEHITSSEPSTPRIVEPWETEILAIYSQLDKTDRLLIQGEILGLLKAEKYKKYQELLNAQ